jgi:hypothetical protein
MVTATISDLPDKPISHHRYHNHDQLMILLTAAPEIPSDLAASAKVRPGSRTKSLASSCEHWNSRIT